MSTIALFGAAGKIGARIASRLREATDHTTLYIEAGEAGQARLRQNGLEPTAQADALPVADAAILAIPDTLIGAVAREIVPQLKPGCMVICLDPAAPYSGELPARADISYFVVHPCHPPVINDETDPEARRDFYGGIKARQAIVCALMQGPEEDYTRGEQIARVMFAPVMRAHRVTVEQMALLEPAMAETVILTCMVVMKEAVDEAVSRGVPREAAYDFALGHININLGILFGYVNAQFSDGAKLAVERAKQSIFQPDWRRVFELSNVMDEVKAITKGRAAGRAR